MKTCFSSCFKRGVFRAISPAKDIQFSWMKNEREWFMAKETALLQCINEIPLALCAQCSSEFHQNATKLLVSSFDFGCDFAPFREPAFTPKPFLSFSADVVPPHHFVSLLLVPWSDHRDVSQRPHDSGHCHGEICGCSLSSRLQPGKGKISHENHLIFSIICCKFLKIITYS